MTFMLTVLELSGLNQIWRVTYCLGHENWWCNGKDNI